MRFRGYERGQRGKVALCVSSCLTLTPKAKGPVVVVRPMLDLLRLLRNNPKPKIVSFGLQEGVGFRA